MIKQWCNYYKQYGQSATAQPRQDGGTLVFVSLPSTFVGRVRVGTIDVLPLSAVRDLGVYVDADVTMSAHVTNNRHGLFCSTAADTKRAAFTDARRLADTDPVTGRNEARLLLFGVDWCVWIADATATVCAERSRSTSVLGEEIRTRVRELHWLKVLSRRGPNTGCVF